MRVAFLGDAVEARQYLGKAQQELFRLKQRMALRGDTQGVFRHQITPNVFCSGYVLPNGIEAINIIATPVEVETKVPVKVDYDFIKFPIYEFATGGFDEYALSPVVATGVSLEYRGPIPRPGVVNDPADSKLMPQTLFSQTFTPAEDEPHPWRFVSPGYFFARDGSEADFFQTFLSYQFQGVHEAVSWPNNNVSGVVHSAWGMTLGRMNTVGLCDALHGDGGTKSQNAIYHGQHQFFSPDIASLVSTYDTNYVILDGRGTMDYTDDDAGVFSVPQFDRLFDIPPVYYQRGSTPLGGIGPYLDDYTWYRHAAMITSNLGNKFFVLADNKGGFFFYRAKAYWNDPVVLAACVDQPGFPGVKAPASTAVAYRRVVPTYPIWVTLPADGVATPLQWWNWQFNKDASKAVTVAMNSTARPKWFHHADVDDPITAEKPAWWEDWFVDPGVVPPNDNVLLFDQVKKGTPCRKDLPGLVEMSIALTESGPGDLDFTVTVSLLYDDYFGDTGTYWVDAGYAYPGLSVPEGSLITAEIECYRGVERWFHKRDPMTGSFSDGAADGSDYDGNNAWLDIDRFGSSWVVKHGGNELAREVLQYNSQIISWLPTFTPGWFDVVPYWTLNNTGRYWLSQKILRLSVTPGFAISQVKGMFIASGPTYGYGNWFDHTISDTKYDAEIVSADLRSLSYVMRQQRTEWPSFAGELTKTLQHKVVAFGKEQVLPSPGKTKRVALIVATGWRDSSSEDVVAYRVGGVSILPYAPFVMPTKPAAQIPMDKDVHEQLFTTVGLSRLPCYSHHEIRTTPAGDWSVWVNDADTGVADVVSTKVAGPTKQTTHLDIFNKAYSMTLEAGYYGTTSGTFGYRNLGGFGLSRNWLPRISLR